MKNYTFLILTTATNPFGRPLQYPQGVIAVRADTYPHAVHKARFIAFLHLKCNPAMIITDLLSQGKVNAGE